VHPFASNQKSDIDTLNDLPYITTERHKDFLFTNPYLSSNLVAIYAQQVNDRQFFNFKGIAAGISLDVYILAIVIIGTLVVLFLLIEYLRPSTKFNCLDIAMAIIPCYNCQIPITLRIDTFTLQI
jgi:hypothetical protein